MSPCDPWPLEEVISDGQTGADQAGLRAAKELYYRTGGMAPRGYRTEDGPALWLGTVYGLIEHTDRAYPPRTVRNVRRSDGTVLFYSGGVADGGTLLTLEICQANRKPTIQNPTVGDLQAWIKLHKIRVLNVAGNREKKSPGIGERVYQLLLLGLLPF